VAGNRFPAYHIASTTPVWDQAARGEWRLVVDGAVQHPLTLSLDDLRKSPFVTQKHHHFCVEGWTAVAAFGGVPLSAMYGVPARLHGPERLGYKNTKYLTTITFMSERNGGYWSDRGYEWYGGT
jgi:DMSO/TMAO reductase YedYZ molybdopterin-dependent catalytic subunit